MMNISNKYACVLGSFRLKSDEIVREALDYVSGRILLDTGVSYNIDHLLTNLDPKYANRIDICSKFGVDHFSEFDFYLTNHLRFLNKEKLTYGLIHFYEDGWKKLCQLMIDDPRIENVGVSNFSIEQIEEYKDYFGEYPSVLEIEFSRRYHDEELIEFCHNHGIEILAYGVLGGIHASKEYIREYLLEDLIAYPVKFDIIPIIRTDCKDHLQQDLYALWEAKEHQIYPSETSGTKSVHYELNADVKDDRALNKFKYDKPKHALEVILPNGDSIITLSSWNKEIPFQSKKVIPLKINDSRSTFFTHSEISRDYMMVTDYIVRQKFAMSEKDVIHVTDDILYNETTGKIYSWNLLSTDNYLIKSGSEEATVYNYENYIY